MLTAAVNRYYASDMDNDAAEKYTRTVWKYLPEDIANAAIKECHGDKDEAIEKMSSVLSDFTDSMSGKIKVRAVFSLGDKVDSDDIKESNNAFHDAKFNSRLKRGYELEVAAVVTAKEDVGTMKAGETKKQDSMSSGMQVVQIGGRWYMWSSSFNSLLEEASSSSSDDSSDDW